MTEVEARPYKQLWAAVILVALADHRKAVEKARSRDAAMNAAALRRGHLAGTSNLAEREIARAARFLGSSDFRILCERAGVGVKADKALEWIAGAGFDTRGRSKRRYAGSMT